MIRRVVRAGLVLCSLVAWPVLALAQPHAGTTFVGGAGLFVIDKAPTSQGVGIAPAEDASGTVAGGTVGLGIHLTSHVVFRAEWSATDTLTRESDFDGILASSVVYDTGQSVSTLPGIRIATPRFSTSRESKALFALAGYHLPAGRRQSIEVMGGLGLVRRSVKSSYEVSFAGPGLPGALLPTPIRSAFTNASYHAVAVVGADLALLVTSRLALVPQVRAYALNGGLSVRPGVGLRWTF